MKVHLEGPLSMELTGGPPTQLLAGTVLPRPMTVTITSSGDKDRSAENKDLNGVWAYVSLVSSDRKQSLAPPREDLLRGKKAISIRPISGGLSHDGDTIGFAEFTDLAVLEPGSYCFRVNIVGMDRSISGNGKSGRVLPDLYTHVFNVV